MNFKNRHKKKFPIKFRNFWIDFQRPPRPSGACVTPSHPPAPIGLARATRGRTKFTSQSVSDF